MRHPQPRQLAALLARLITALDTPCDNPKCPGDHAPGTAHGPLALELSEVLAARGFPAGSGGTSSGGSGMSTTEAAALHPDVMTTWHQSMTQLMAWLYDNALDLENLIAKVIRREKNTGRVSQVILCANPNCEVDITGLGRSRCEPCAKYRQRNDRDAPRAVVAERDGRRAG